MTARPHPLAWQVTLPWIPETLQHRKIARQLESHHDVGVPVGGIGTGAIARGPNGGFTRWTLKAGQVVYASQAGNGFALWQRPEGGTASARALRPVEGGPPGWRLDPAGRYAALFPKAWHIYEESSLSLTIEQLSPVVPELEEDADLPLGVFAAHLTNTGETRLEAAVMLSFMNLVGWFGGFRGMGHQGGVAGHRNDALEGTALTGVRMMRDHVGALEEGEGEMLIAVRPDPGLEITLCPAFDPDREGQSVWDGFAADGRLRAR